MGGADVGNRDRDSDLEVWFNMPEPLHLIPLFFSQPLWLPLLRQKGQWCVLEKEISMELEKEIRWWIERKKSGKKEEFELLFWAGCSLAHLVQSRNSQSPLATRRDRARQGAKSWLPDQCQVFWGSIRLL